jgi:hypothetical protein
MMRNINPLLGIEITCKNCGTNETVRWRKARDGKSRLCNACGLYEVSAACPSQLMGTSIANDGTPSLCYFFDC